MTTTSAEGRVTTDDIFCAVCLDRADGNLLIRLENLQHKVGKEGRLCRECYEKFIVRSRPRLGRYWTKDLRWAGRP